MSTISLVMLGVQNIWLNFLFYYNEKANETSVETEVKV